MKHERLLTVTSLLTVLLLSFHLSDDVVRGFEPGGPLNLVGIFIMVVWLVGVLLLNGRLAGYIITFVGGVLAPGVALIHMTGAGMVGGRIEGSTGILFWVWTMMAAGAVGLFSAVLAVMGIWSLRRRK